MANLSVDRDRPCLPAGMPWGYCMPFVVCEFGYNHRSFHKVVSIFDVKPTQCFFNEFQFCFYNG